MVPLLNIFNMQNEFPKAEPTKLEDRCNPKALQDEFFGKHNRTLPLQSFQILHQCYHPNFHHTIKSEAPLSGDYILILEQQYRPQYPKAIFKRAQYEPKMTTVELSEYRNYAIQNPILEQEEEEEGKDSLLIQEKERLPGRISCSHRALAQHYRQQLGIAAVGPPPSANTSIDREGASMDKSSSSAASRSGAIVDKSKKPGGKGTIKHASTATMIGKSKTLNKLEFKDEEEDSKLTSFKVSLWKVDAGEPAFIMAEQRIEVSSEVYVLNNKMLFSQDGKYIFLVLVDDQRKLWQTVTLDGTELRHAYELDFDLSKTKVNAQDVKSDAQMIRLKDDYVASIVKALSLDDSSRANNYIISLQDHSHVHIITPKGKSLKFERKVVNPDGNMCKIQHMAVSVDDSEEKMVFLVKMTVNERDKNPKLITYLTSIQKTLAKIFQGVGPKFTDELIYTSNIALGELSGEFRLRQAFFHKEHGLFMKVASKQSMLTNRHSHLLFLPRTSLFTGKDTNQFQMKMQEFHLMQNPSHHKDVSFISSSESQHFVYLAKDLFKNESEVFSHKNTYQVREKFSVKLTNQLDFKLNLSQGYCTILNSSNETFERPFLTYYQKQPQPGQEGTSLQVIDKFELQNVNPYLLLMEDKSVLNIYSMLEPERHYRFRIEDQFMQFVELSRGQLTLDKEKYYRHQASLYLTLNDKAQLRLNCLLMPSYADVQDSDSPLYRLNLLPFYIDWTKYKSQQILKAALVQIPTKSDCTMTLLVQLRAKILVINLASGQVRSFETNSTVPFLLQHPDETVEGPPIQGKTVYVHTVDAGQQGVAQLEISALEQPRMLSVLEFTSARVLKMQQIGSQSLLLFDENLQLKKYKLQQKTLKMKLVDEKRIVEEARKLLVTRPGLTPCSLEVTEQAVYINGVFFQVLQKQAQKDNYSEFEASREKRVDRHVTPGTLCIGPLLSLDKYHLIYVYKGNKSIASQVKAPDPNAGPGGEKQATLYKLLQALMRMRDRALMKPDEPAYQIVQVPLLMQNSLPLLHSDDFLKERVELSTFTAQDDILLKLSDRFLAFDSHGNQLPVTIEERLLENLRTFKVFQTQKIVRATSIDRTAPPSYALGGDTETFLAILLELPGEYEAMVLQLRKLASPHDLRIHHGPSYEVSVLIDRHKLVPQELLKDREFSIKYRKTRIEEDGHLYQLLLGKKRVREDKYREELYFTKDGVPVENIQRDMLRVYKKKSKVPMRSTNLQDTRNSVVIEPSKKTVLGNFLMPSSQSDDLFYDYDFAVLPPSADLKRQYIVLKKDLELHYKDVLDLSPTNIGLKEIKLELDRGAITQLLPTYQVQVLQFLYTQAKPMQHYVFTWDLDKNLECQMHTFKASLQIPYLHIKRGITTRENYFIPSAEPTLYDLRFQFPLNFYSGQEACRGLTRAYFNEKEFKKDFDAYSDFLHAAQRDFLDEYKVASRNEAMLGVSKARLATLQYPHSYISLQYAQYIIDTYKEIESRSEESQKVKPILSYLQLSMQNENNILHLFALNENFLKAFQKEIRSAVTDYGDTSKVTSVYYVLLPNHTNTKNGRRPLSMALRQYSPKCLEQMLDLLTIDSKQDYMRYIERYLHKLLQMRSVVFYRFFDVSCSRFQFRMQGTLKQDTVYLQKPTQYINQTSFMKTFHTQVKENTGTLSSIICCCFKRGQRERANELFGKVAKGVKDKIGKKKKTTAAGLLQDEAEEAEEEIEQFQLLDEDLENDDALSDEYEEGDKGAGLFGGSKKQQASINFYSYEFESIMKGKKGADLIKYLSEQPLQSPLFESPTVHAYLDAQWQQFRMNYYAIVILYLTSFVIMFPSYEMFQKVDADKDPSFLNIMLKHWLFFFIFLPIQFIISVYLTYFEWLKMVRTRQYFQFIIVVYNFIQIMQPVIDMLGYIAEDAGTEFKDILPSLQHGFNAVFVIFGLIVLIYKIKYLNIAKFYITRFYLVMMDTWQLVGCLFIVQMTFAYAYNIIYTIQLDHRNYGIGVIFKAFEFYNEDTFNTLWTLWQNSVKSPDPDPTQFNLFYLFLVILTVGSVATQLLLTYFLVSAIIESYNKVSQNIQNQVYLSRAKILYENSLIFRRETVFADTRYVIKAQAERIDGDRAKGELDGVTNAITASVRTTVEQESRKTEGNFKFLKTKIEKLAAAQENLQVAADMQQHEFKQQMSVMMRFIGDMAGRGGAPTGVVGGTASAPKKKDDKPKFAKSKEQAFMNDQ